MKSEIKTGFKDGIPIALGYFAVSFGMGIMIINSGMNALQGGLMSVTNMTSAGQFAGITIIASAGTIIEMILTQLIINLRYALMSLSLSQKLSKNVKMWQRFIIAFANTDEIFAVAMAHNKGLTFSYMIGLQSLPILGWTGGTVLGALCGNIMPDSIRVATGVALYGMFIAVVVPAAKKARPVFITALIALIISSLLYYVPAFDGVSDGIAIIISTVIAASLGAVLFPVKEEEDM